jgi:hypothetical protein
LKYFKVGFIPYKDKQESDIIFWFYHEGMRTSCGLLPSYIGLYSVFIGLDRKHHLLNI